jgi:hypothetical protein
VKSFNLARRTAMAGQEVSARRACATGAMGC